MGSYGKQKVAPSWRGADSSSTQDAKPSHTPRRAGGLEDALAMALQYVVARPRTAYEVRQKLVRLGVSDSAAESIMVDLHTRGLLDDVAYTQAYLSSRLSHRGYGPQRLRRELSHRGVQRALIEDAVQHTLDIEDVLAAARIQAAKRWARLTRDVDAARRRQKVYDFLRRRGFASAIAQQVLTELSQDTARD